MTLSDRIVALTQAIASDINIIEQGLVITLEQFILQRKDIAEIQIYASTDTPNSWISCKGQLLAIANYPQLFAKIGSAFGGDGVTTFAVPNMRNIRGMQRIILVTLDDIVVVPASIQVPTSIISPTNSIYWAGDLLRFSVQLLEPVTVTGGSPKLSVTIGSNTYLLNLLTTTETVWTYEYIVQSVDFGNVTAAIDLNGAALTVATVPANLDSYLVTSLVLGIQLSTTESAMIPTAQTNAITQIQQLSGAGTTMIPTAQTNTITI